MASKPSAGPFAASPLPTTNLEHEPATMRVDKHCKVALATAPTTARRDLVYSPAANKMARSNVQQTQALARRWANKSEASAKGGKIIVKDVTPEKLLAYRHGLSDEGKHPFGRLLANNACNRQWLRDAIHQDDSPFPMPKDAQVIEVDECDFDCEVLILAEAQLTLSEEFGKGRAYAVKPDWWVALINEQFQRITARYRATQLRRLGDKSPQAMEIKRQRINATKHLIAFMLGVPAHVALEAAPDEEVAIPKAKPKPRAKAERVAKPAAPPPPRPDRRAELHDITPQVFIAKPRPRVAKPKAEEPAPVGLAAPSPSGGLGGAVPTSDQGGLAAKSRSPRGVGMAMPAVRAATEGGASGSGGTGVGSANPPPKAPSKGSRAFQGGTPEAEFGLLIAMILGPYTIPEPKDKGVFKRTRVKGTEAIVGKKAPTADEVSTALADPAQNHAMRDRMHYWLYVAFTKVIERHITMPKSAKQTLVDILSWRVDLEGLFDDMAAAMVALPRSPALMRVFVRAVSLTVHDLWMVDCLPPAHEAHPIADLSLTHDLDPDDPDAPKAVTGKGKAKAKDEAAPAPWQRQQRQRTDEPQDKGKGKDDPRDQHHDAKGKWGKGRGGDGKGKGDQGMRRGRTDARDDDQQRGRTRTTRGQRPTGDDQGWW